MTVDEAMKQTVERRIEVPFRSIENGGVSRSLLSSPQHTVVNYHFGINEMAI